MPMFANQMIQCPRCGQQFNAQVEAIVDPALDPQSKVRLLGGNLNMVQCPTCSAAFNIAAPIVFHDASKELLISFVPPEVAMPKDEKEKVIGNLIKQATANLPADGPKGYLFRPREALTMQGLIEQVLEADGITKDMMDEQRERVRLAETFAQSSPEALDDLIEQHDDRIDSQFMQTLTLMAQRMLQQGRPDLAEQVVQVQHEIIEKSSYGQELNEQSAIQEQAVQEVAAAIQALGENAQRDDILKLVLQFRANDDYLQALVGLIRPAFDYQFFQDFTAHIGKAAADERDELEAAKDRLVELTAMIDQQMQAAVQEAAQTLQGIINQPNLDEAIRANVALIDDTFMQVLTANIQESERRQDLATSARLKEIYEKVVAILRENMQPELRFINELLTAKTDEEARELLSAEINTYGEQLLPMMDAVKDVLAAQGQPELIQRLEYLRAETEQMLS